MWRTVYKKGKQMIKTRITGNKKTVTMQTNQQVTPSKNTAQVTNERIFTYAPVQVELSIDKHIMTSKEE